MAKKAAQRTVVLLLCSWLAVSLLTPSSSTAQEAVLGMPRIAKPEDASSDGISAESTIDQLVQRGVAANPRLQRLRYQWQAAQARVPQVRALPDPTIDTNTFGDPIQTFTGSQRGNLTIAQRLPWFGRLNARGQEAAIQAEALHQLLVAESIKVASQIKVRAYRLYVVGQDLRINKQNQTLVKQLARVATGRIAVNKATQGDVLRATLELSRLVVEIKDLEQRLISEKASLNELLDRSAESALPVPEKLDPVFDEDWTLKELRQVASAKQPELLAAALREEAARIGVRVAHLQQVPDLTVSFSTFFIDNDRPPQIPDVGQDAWAVGLAVNIPIWQHKYNAIRQEANARLGAAAADFRVLVRRYDAAIAEALAQADAAHKTTRIFADSVLPQARQTLAADQQSYQQGKVEFDRVIIDFRNLVNAELGYHRAIGQLGVAVARLEQLIGITIDQLQTHQREGHHERYRGAKQSE